MQVICGDPTCAPIDTVLQLTWDEGLSKPLGIPMPSAEVTEDVLKEVFVDPSVNFEAWQVGALRGPRRPWIGLHSQLWACSSEMHPAGPLRQSRRRSCAHLTPRRFPLSFGWPPRRVTSLATCGSGWGRGWSAAWGTTL